MSISTVRDGNVCVNCCQWTAFPVERECYDSGVNSAVVLIVIVAIVLGVLIHPLFALLALLAFLFI